MEIIFVLMAISLFMAGLGLTAFLWANADGQFDDLETPSESVLVEDARPRNI
jgi:cbb3-type cytochrome oxidase maturation protein